ncbi:hypothetical protein EJ05DRAFT_534560 [Pseudovirgaria hyperparasitica]|uniref:Uncharacterized protein n=1 Tax=Pseudovirgaria hyperparasitica TaxID=470096 RepID=A0A6A6WLX5_9PEZI|nr:uncharacterized protein EJ05DRAFT_534560 [Pseudovirgaria hyperparasitica]KAF2763158.1 hypothetical protein EJ05DRAFT_534560 [Pseudovirgaria hyperparasitica]
MRFSTLAMAAAAASGVVAQEDTSLCGKYTTALLMNNTAENQYMLLQLLVNRVVTGATQEQVSNGSAVPGILAPGNVNGTDVNLLPYFDGSLASTNRNGEAVSVNFLADGGATPLTASPPKPANSTDSPQYYLLTHLYSFFGALLQCQVGSDGFPAYEGNPSMAKVHMFMALTNAENTYFIQQVGAAAVSFGVTMDDVSTVAEALVSTFNYRCSPAAKIVGDMEELQSICQAEDCPLSPNANCDAYPNSGAVSSPTPTPSGSAAMTPTGGSSPTNTGAASTLTYSAGAGVAGLIAAIFAL